MHPVLLHVEDEPDDALLVRMALRRTCPFSELHQVEDSKGAIDYLAGSGEFRDRQRYPLPDLVLLDLKLPGLTGLEVLTWIRERVQFQHTPVVILSGSCLEEDRRQALALGADAFFVKTASYRDVIEFALRTLEVRRSPEVLVQVPA